MSLSQEQYYQAKVFLKAMHEAHQALEDSAKQTASVRKLQSYAQNITESAAKGQIVVKEGVIHKSQSFEGSRYRQLASFTNKYFNDRLAGFHNIKTSDSLSALLERAMK